MPVSSNVLSSPAHGERSDYRGRFSGQLKNGWIDETGDWQLLVTRPTAELVRQRDSARTLALTYWLEFARFGYAGTCRILAGQLLEFGEDLICSLE